MNNQNADQSNVLPSRTWVFNILASKFGTLMADRKKHFTTGKHAEVPGGSFADRPTGGYLARYNYLLAHHPRVVVANLAFLPDR